jgi:adenylate kinase family enzyme
LEKEGNGSTSWIIEGFPRTRLQAIALQKMSVVPDKFILLDIAENISIDKVKRNLKSDDEIIQFQEGYNLPFTKIRVRNTAQQSELPSFRTTTKAFGFSIG